MWICIFYYHFVSFCGSACAGGPSQALLDKLCDTAPDAQAVIGAGPAGITTARELQREGHDATVFEQMPDIGGVWLPDQLSEDEALGAGLERKGVHSSLYDSLRTNLPRELMGFSDFPFMPRYMKVPFSSYVYHLHHLGVHCVHPQSCHIEPASGTNAAVLPRSDVAKPRSHQREGCAALCSYNV